MALPVKNENINEEPSAVQILFPYRDKDINSLSPSKTKELVCDLLANEDKSLKEDLSLKQHCIASNGIVWSYLSEGTRVTSRVGCGAVNESGFIVANGGTQLNNALSYFSQCVSKNANVIRIYYFENNDEIWAILKDKSYKEYKQLILECESFQDDYPDFEYLALEESQIIYDEMPNPDVTLERAHNG